MLSTAQVTAQVTMQAAAQAIVQVTDLATDLAPRMDPVSIPQADSVAGQRLAYCQQSYAQARLALTQKPSTGGWLNG